MFSFDFPPKGWAFCNGQLLPISQNQALFNVIQTTYGGDGRVNFALPDLQGRAPLNADGSFLLGERGGQVQHIILAQEMPTHSHDLIASNLPTGNHNRPLDSYLAPPVPGELYTSSPNTYLGLSPEALTTVSGSQAHSNMQPFITIAFCIALQGLTPV